VASGIWRVVLRQVSGPGIVRYNGRARAKFAAARLPCRSNFALLARCVELGLIRLDEIEDYRPMQPDPR